MSNEEKICARARKLFAQRDRLVAQLRAIDAELTEARADYRVEARIVGIDMVRFRNAVHQSKIAA